MKKNMHSEKRSKNHRPVLVTVMFVAGLAIVGSLLTQALAVGSATAAGQQGQNANQTSGSASQQNATSSEATRNATSSAQNAAKEAGNATASAGNALGNATSAAGGIIGGALSNATSSLKKAIGNPLPSTITVAPNSVNAGDIVVVKGSGFSANDTITVTFGNSSSATTTANSDKSGAFNTTITTPRDAKGGSYNITAKDTHGKSATASVEIIALPKTPFAPTSFSYYPSRPSFFS
jgi:hypothetical protein